MADFMESVASAMGQESGDVPSLGGFYSAGSEKIVPGKLRVRARYIVCNISDPNDAAVAEDIMTRALRSNKHLREPGDLNVLSETNTFTKDGIFLVAIKYIEVIDDTSLQAAAEDSVELTDRS